MTMVVDIRFGEGSLPELMEADEILHLANDAPAPIVSGLRDGMSSGKPSVVIAIPLDENRKRWVVWELSWELFTTVYSALGARLE